MDQKIVQRARLLLPEVELEGRRIYQQVALEERPPVPLFLDLQQAAQALLAQAVALGVPGAPPPLEALVALVACL